MRRENVVVWSRVDLFALEVYRPSLSLPRLDTSDS
jgi:hypothetical protein